MSFEPSVTAADAAAPSPPAINQAWSLHSAGRVFGPLDEDQMRAYFRAGMVKSVDIVAVPGQSGTVSALEAASLLGMPPPVAASAAAAFVPTSITVTDMGDPPRPTGLLVALAFTVLVGAAYFTLHESYVPPHERLAGEPIAISTQPAASAAVPVPADASAPAAQAPITRPSAHRPDTNSSNDHSEAPPQALATGSFGAPVDAAPTPRAAPNPWGTEASRLYKLQDWPALRAHAEQWTRAEPQVDKSWWYLGLARYRLEDFPGTVAACQEALRISPRHLRIRWLMSDAYMAMQQWRQSLDVLHELAKEEPNDAALWNDIGTGYAKLGEYDEAIAALEKSVKLDPGYRRGWQNLVYTYGKFGHKDRARDAAARANAR